MGWRPVPHAQSAPRFRTRTTGWDPGGPSLATCRSAQSKETFVVSNRTAGNDGYRSLGRVLINPVQQPLADVRIFATRCRRVTDGAEPRRHKAFRCADRYASRDQPDYERRVREVSGPSVVDGCSSFDKCDSRSSSPTSSAPGPRRQCVGARLGLLWLNLVWKCVPCPASRQGPDDSLVVTLGDGRQLVPVLLARLRYVVQVPEEFLVAAWRGHKDMPRITDADICETVNDASWNYHAGAGADGLSLIADEIL
jgi:hypothetical protein